MLPIFFKKFFRLWPFFTFCWLFDSQISNSIASEKTPLAPVKRLMLLGDSWAHFMWAERSFQKVFRQFSKGQFEESGDWTALAGSTAAEWASPLYQKIIEMSLKMNPTIDLVFLSVGGNDMIEFYKAAYPDEIKRIIAQEIGKNIQKIIDYLHLQKPSLKIILNGYDYGNLEESLKTASGKNLWKRLGKPNTIEINKMVIILEEVKKNIALKNPQTYYLHNFGLMQYIFGYPKKNLPPFNVNPPSSGPDFANFPGGRWDLPSPPAGMANISPDFLNEPFLKKFPCFDFVDTIHLSKAGYYYIAWHAYVEYIKNWL